MFKRNREASDRLFQAVLTLRNIDECYKFFDDVCTIQEIETIAQRLEVAENLIKGQSYLEVNKKTGASTATISRVGKSVNYGNGGYEMVINRMEGKEDDK